MKIAISDGKIICAEVGGSFDGLRRTGRFKWVKSRKTMEAVVSLYSLEALRSVCRLPSQCAAEYERLVALNEAVEREKQTKHPVPLCDYPIKNAKLMAHQVRGANIAMLLFGAGGDNDGDKRET